MKIRYVILLVVIVGLMVVCGNDWKVELGFLLKEVVLGKFLMGVVLNVCQVVGQDIYVLKVVKCYFNFIVVENCMKCEVIYLEEDCFDFMEVDWLVCFGEENDMVVIGYCFIWYLQLVFWFCVDE